MTSSCITGQIFFSFIIDHICLVVPKEEKMGCEEVNIELGFSIFIILLDNFRGTSNCICQKRSDKYCFIYTLLHLVDKIMCTIS